MKVKIILALAFIFVGLGGLQEYFTIGESLFICLMGAFAFGTDNINT